MDVVLLSGIEWKLLYFAGEVYIHHGELYLIKYHFVCVRESYSPRKCAIIHQTQQMKDDQNGRKVDEIISYTMKKAARAGIEDTFLIRWLLMTTS